MRIMSNFKPKTFDAKGQFERIALPTYCRNQLRLREKAACLKLKSRSV